MTICCHCHGIVAVEGEDYCQYCLDRKRNEERECATTQADLGAWFD